MKISQKQTLSGINIVIASGSGHGSERVQSCFQQAFIRRGAIVSLCGVLSQEFVLRIEYETADIILIFMDDCYRNDEQALELLLERTKLPILFHENNVAEVNETLPGCDFLSEQLKNKLASKLFELFENSEFKRETTKKIEPSAIKKPSAIKEPLANNKLLLTGQVNDFLLEKKVFIEKKHCTNLENYSPEHAVNVWILGASIGGPQSVKRFLSRIPAELPVAFVLAQHLGDGFISLLANQLDRTSSFKVKEAISGDILRHGEVIVVPVANCMTLDENAQVGFNGEHWQGHYKPSIDSVIIEVISSFEARSGIIIFSGMGSDGVSSSQKFVKKHRGIVWVQNSETCVISSMPDSVCKAIPNTYSGSPEELAVKISKHYMGNNFN